jgi:TPR repeat protein
MLRTLALAALLLVTALQASAGLKEGVAALDRGDYGTAYLEFKPLAEQGDAIAQHNLGLMYEKGWGIPKNYREAAKWYRKAALQGDAKAQFNLGVMYGNGQGVPRDYVQAYMWISLAATAGNKIAAENLKIVEKRMTPAQVAKAQEMAAKWRPKKAKPSS